MTAIPAAAGPPGLGCSRIVDWRSSLITSPGASGFYTDGWLIWRDRPRWSGGGVGWGGWEGDGCVSILPRLCHSQTAVLPRRILLFVWNKPPAPTPAQGSSAARWASEQNC